MSEKDEHHEGNHLLEENPYSEETSVEKDATEDFRKQYSSVPKNFAGVRGLSPRILIIGFTGLLLVGGGFIITSRIHGADSNIISATPSSDVAAASQVSEATLRYPDPSPIPAQLVSNSHSRGFLPFKSSPTTSVPINAQPANLSVAAVTTAPPQPVQPAPAVQPQVQMPADSTAYDMSDRMQLEQPSARQMTMAQPNQNASVQNDVHGTAYRAVYVNGKLVGVTPVENGSAPEAKQLENHPVAVTNESDSFVSSSGRGANGSRFLQGQQNADVGYIKPVSPYQLNVGSIINARLVNKISSDLPGVVIAQITQNVYASRDNNVLVIPIGTKVFGVYSNELNSTTSRLQIAFERLIFPDGREFAIGGQIGGDTEGASGFEGDVDRHHGQLYTTAFLTTALTGAEAALSPQTSGAQYGGQGIGAQVQAAAGAQLSQIGNNLIKESAERPATIIIRPGYQFAITVSRDLPLNAYDE